MIDCSRNLRLGSTCPANLLTRTESEQPQIGRMVLADLRSSDNKADNNKQAGSPVYSPHQQAAAKTFCWPGFDSFLFDSSELLPADGAAGDTGPQPSPLPPKPKLQQPIGDSALGGQQWTPVLVKIFLLHSTHQVI